MQKLLQESQRAEPSAYCPSQRHSEKQDDTHHVPSGAMSGRSQRVLECAERTGTDRSGTGIAVKARNTRIFSIALINLTDNKAFQMRIVQKRTVELNESSFRWTETLPSCIHCILIIQGRYTLYIYLPPCQIHRWRFR